MPPCYGRSVFGRPDRRALAPSGRLPLDRPDAAAKTRPTEVIDALCMVAAGINTGRHELVGPAIGTVPFAFEQSVQLVPNLWLLRVTINDDIGY